MRCFGFIVKLSTIVSLVSKIGVEGNVSHVRRLPVKHVDNNVFNVHNGPTMTYYPEYDSTDPMRVEHKTDQSDPYQQQHANWLLSSQQHNQEQQNVACPLTGMPVWFDHHVFHIEGPAKRQQVHRKHNRMTKMMTTPVASRLKKRNSQVKHFHDIFSRYEEPQKVAFGHIEQGPTLFEQRFESINKGNRYKGDIKWYDPAGGYGEYHWNLAQGKL